MTKMSWYSLRQERKIPTNSLKQQTKHTLQLMCFQHSAYICYSNFLKVLAAFSLTFTTIFPTSLGFVCVYVCVCLDSRLSQYA